MTGHDLFAWFDGLGFPDLARLPYVRVFPGWERSSGSGLPERVFFSAFLLGEEGDHFTFFTMALEQQQLTRSPPATPQHRVEYERADLRADVERHLAYLAATDTHPFGGAHRHFGATLGSVTDLFVLARACAAHGLDDLAGALLQRAGREHAADERNRVPLRQQISDEIARRLTWQALEAGNDPSVSRADLLTRFERILTQFPAREGEAEAGDWDPGWQLGRHGLLVGEAVEILRRMIAEDEEHARRPDLPFAELSRLEQIEELTYQLRDQCAHQWCDPGDVNPFDDERGELSPAHRLVQYGPDAVPRLIAALDDCRFTRCLGHHRSYYFSHYLLRIGDCALAVLERIAGQSFWRPRNTWAAMFKDGEAEATRRKVVAWWESVQVRGEGEVLAEVVRAGDRNSITAAGSLVERHPEIALEALRAGAARTAETWVRAALIELAGRVPGDEALAFLREQLSDGPLSVRAKAAWALLCRDQADAVPAMIDAWHAIREPDGGAELLGFLLGCRRVEAVRALAEDLPRRTVRLRAMAIDTWTFQYAMSHSQPVPAEVEEAFQDLHAGLLNDREVLWGMSGSHSGKSICNPRLCDLAADQLARRLERPELFDLEAGRGDRDRQCVEVANLCRARRGLPLLPLPDASAVCLPDDRAWEVVSVNQLPDSATLPADRQQRLDSLPGRLLEAGTLVELILTSLRTLPPDVVGLELQVEREGDRSGATVEFRLLPRRYPPPRERPTWGQNGSIHVNRKLTWSIMGGSAYSHGLTEECWHDFAEALRAALAAPADTSVSVLLHVTTEQGSVRIAES
jgi:hypothetical protein